MINELIMSIKATNGILNVFEDRVEISRKTALGTLSQGIKGDRILFYKDLTSIEYKKPSMMANGYIKFIVAGTQDANSAVTLLGTTTQEALKDPNLLVFRAFNKQIPAMSEQAYILIMQKISNAKASISSSPSEISNADEIMKFKQLFDTGIITQEEFEKKKKQLLGS